MKKILSMLVIALLILSMVFVPFLVSAEGATIWTDKADYAPNETVTIYGSGFLADAQVTITITAPDLSVDTIYAWTDGSGAFTHNYLLDGITGTYTVTATDGTDTETVTFTDTQKNFTSTISPTTSDPSQTQTYTVTITNDPSNPSGNKLGSAKVNIPSGFTSVSVTSVTASAGKSWTATVVSAQIKLTAADMSNRLDPGQYVSVSFSATAPATPGTYEWTTTAYTNPSWSGDVFHLVGSQPKVTVSAPTTVSITITSSPVTGADFVKVDDNPITTPTIFTWTIGSTHKLGALSPVAGSLDTQYVWTSWSDGGAQTHDYTVPSSAATVTANYKTQYYLTVVSPYSTTGGEGWYDKDAPAYATVTPLTVPGPIDVQYVFTHWSGDASGTTSPSDSITMNAPKTATANWKTQYYLTVVSDHGTPSGEGWYDECTYAYAGLDTGMVEEDGTRYLFVEWTVDATGTDYAKSDAIHMDGPKTAIAEWKTQYYLTVVSPYDTPGGEGWYDEGATAHATLATGTVDITPGLVRAVFMGWIGDASGTGLTSNGIFMDGPKTAIANWTIQYYLDVVTDPSTLPPIPGADWYDNCTWVELTAPQYVPSEAGMNGVRYTFSYWDVDGTSQGIGVNPIDIHMNASHIATAYFTLQYLVTFNQTGVGSDFTGTVVVIDGSNYNVGVLPTSFWYDNGTTHNFAFQSPLVVPPGAKQYDWTSTTGLSSLQSGSILVTGLGSVTGNYVTRVHDVAVTNVVANRTWVYQGKSCGFGVNVTVLNKGDFPETVNVTLYYNITANQIIGTQIINLPLGQSQTLVFTWNTTGVEYCHNYTMTAVATIAADYYPADNTLADGKVKVRIMGDVDGNGEVSMFDIRLIAKAFGSYPGDPKWNPDYDLNQSGGIDMFDIRLVAKNFGKCAI